MVRALILGGAVEGVDLHVLYPCSNCTFVLQLAPNKLESRVDSHILILISRYVQRVVFDKDVLFV